MGSGLIYLIIVGMWIAYFLPRWIASHEEVSGRSIEKFANTMKVVGRTSGNESLELDEIRKRHASQITSRRILFSSILAAIVLIAGFTVAGIFTPIILLLPLSALILYTVHARHQIAAAEEELARAIAAQPERARDKYRELIARSRRIAYSRIEMSEEQWIPLADRLASAESESNGITIIPKGIAGRLNTWDPIEVPAPSYISAAKAAPRKIIDLTIPGAWSEEQQRLLQEVMKSSPNEIFDQTIADEVEEQIRINRAANQ
jgi:hypothetical protein